MDEIHKVLGILQKQLDFSSKTYNHMSLMLETKIRVLERTIGENSKQLRMKLYSSILWEPIEFLLNYQVLTSPTPITTDTYKLLI